MRPVNLIPPEERRGDRAPSRTGAAPYLIVGLLAVVLVAVVGLALTSKQISDRKAEKSALQADAAEARERADALAPYAEFAATSSARVATVTSLAQSRFDWVRVFKELSLVLPDDVWLTDLSGSVSSTSAASASGLADGLDVPTLSIKGCAAGHDAVAEFIEALEDIDGVTRVGVSSSERGDSSTSGGSSSGGDGGSTSCRTRSFIAGFEIAVAFDAATVPAVSEVPPAPTGDVPAADPQVADAQQQEQQVRDSTAEQTEKAHNAAEVIPGTVR